MAFKLARLAVFSFLFSLSFTHHGQHVEPAYEFAHASHRVRASVSR